MHEGTRLVLEFDRIIKVISGLALTPFGKAALNRIHPYTDARRAESISSKTTELLAYLSANPSLPLEAASDIEKAFDALAISGRPLDVVQLKNLAKFLASMNHVQAAVKCAVNGPFPTLQATIDECRTFKSETSAINNAIDDQGNVSDNASSELLAIRKRFQKLRSRLRGTLESYLRGRETSKYLQEKIISERNGRFVLLIRSEHRGAIPGIVHGNSGSGASLFLEPLSTVEINNEIVKLEQDETQEIRRILLSLSDSLRKRALDFRHIIATATDLDSFQARAIFSQLIDGIGPTLTTEPTLKLPGARHPLLIPAIRNRATEQPQETHTARSELEPVPVNIEITPPTNVLIVTGPNTGGKTVALKTAGLLVLMAQSGLHIPTDPQAVVGLFKSVFADIGDEQSISNSLSTFSGHITRILEMDRNLTLPSLLLLDEVGSGTDPSAGGALASAIIDRFRQRGAIVLATTHDDYLKSYASTTEGVTCAGFGFDPDNYTPTFRLSYGIPGRSLALEIAAKLGMPEAVIENARERQSSHEAQLSDYLNQLEKHQNEFETSKSDIIGQREKISKEQEQLQVKQLDIEAREKAIQAKIDRGVDSQLHLARKEIDTVLKDLRSQISNWEKQNKQNPETHASLSTGQTGMFRLAATNALDKISTKYATAQPKTNSSSKPGVNTKSPSIGNRVSVQSLQVEGEVVATHGQEVEVQVGDKRLRTGISDINVLAQQSETGKGGIYVGTQSASSQLTELNVVGCRVDEAIAKVDKFVDLALIGEKHQLRIIHGHGTGQLRRAISDFLEDHPMVVAIEKATPDHGGSGVTTIELKAPSIRPQ